MRDIKSKQQSILNLYSIGSGTSWSSGCIRATEDSPDIPWSSTRWAEVGQQKKIHHYGPYRVAGSSIPETCLYSATWEMVSYPAVFSILSLSTTWWQEATNCCSIPVEKLKEGGPGRLTWKAPLPAPEDIVTGLVFDQTDNEHRRLYKCQSETQLTTLERTCLLEWVLDNKRLK